ncbi:MAG TPA: type II secretion system F family protein [Stellaceae bacterium]|nr:type II secretion system F family protein [Stellaceae bacterium]
MGLGLDPETQIAVVCAIGVALTFGLVAMALSGDAAGRRFNRRLNSMRDRAQGILPSEVAATRSLSRQQSASTIDRLARTWLPRRDLLAARLARTGRTISIGQYSIAITVLTILSAIGLVGATRIGIVPSLLLGLLIGTALPHLVIGRMGKRRLAAFIKLFPEAIDLMVRALRSGLPISEAIVGAGHEIADPVGSELRVVESGMRMGRDLESLLWDTAKRIDASEFRFFVIALSVQRETGGNLGETLANLADVLRRRRQMKAKAHAMASETRATTMILGGLPIAVILVLMLTSPAYLAPLFNDVRGLILDGIAVTMLVTGVVIMNKMAKFEI